MILITGFGPFLDVLENPSGRLARSCDGLCVGGEPILGIEIPVSYVDSIRQTLAIIDTHRPRLVLGLGVSRQSTSARLESYGYQDYSPTLRDVDGCVGCRPQGPARVPASVDVDKLGETLSVSVSDDPGRYVCNAWLYEVSLGCEEIPVGFLHIPSEGFSLERLLGGLDTYLMAQIRNT